MKGLKELNPHLLINEKKVLKSRTAQKTGRDYSISYLLSAHGAFSDSNYWGRLDAYRRHNGLRH